MKNLKINYALFIVFNLFLGLSLHAQTGCVKGDCQNGTGTYVFESGTRYVGGFLGGKCHGQGVLYDGKGVLFRKGSYKYDEFTGQGKEYDENGKLLYEGDFREDKYHGKGTYYWKDGGKYTGEWRNDFENGQGKYISKSGDTYTGGFKDGNKHGRGTYTWKNGDKYIGDWVNGLKEGEGTFTWKNGDKYIGRWKDENFNGIGTQTWKSGNKYIGEWKDGNQHGNGVWEFTASEDGKKIEAVYKNGEIIEGTIYYWNGDKYTGKLGIKEEYGSVIITPHGYGTYTYSDYETETGTWHYGDCNSCY